MFKVILGNEVERSPTFPGDSEIEIFAKNLVHGQTADLHLWKNL